MPKPPKRVRTLFFNFIQYWKSLGLPLATGNDVLYPVEGDEVKCSVLIRCDEGEDLFVRLVAKEDKCGLAVDDLINPKLVIRTASIYKEIILPATIKNSTIYANRNHQRQSDNQEQTTGC